MHLSANERDLLAYYHLRSCDWIANENRPCNCGLIQRVTAIVAQPDGVSS